MKHFVAKEDDTYYYRKNEGPPATYAIVDLGKINWLELSKQKLSLLKLIWDDERHPCWGIVELIDRIQDDAEKNGQPVVWMTEESEDIEGLPHLPCSLCSCEECKKNKPGPCGECAQCYGWTEEGGTLMVDDIDV